jgi:hypothetical protein
MGGWWNKQWLPGAGGRRASSGGSKRVRLSGGLGLRARAELGLPMLAGGRTHLGAALANGLRERSAGVAAKMLGCPVHANVHHATQCIGRAKSV